MNQNEMNQNEMIKNQKQCNNVSYMSLINKRYLILAHVLQLTY